MSARLTRLSKSSATIADKLQKGEWLIVEDLVGYRKPGAVFLCPECSELVVLARNHRIGWDGAVLPAVDHQRARCSFRGYVILSGWSGSPRATPNPSEQLKEEPEVEEVVSEESTEPED